MFESAYIDLAQAAVCLRVPIEVVELLLSDGAVSCVERQGRLYLKALDVAEIRKDWDRYPIEDGPDPLH